MISTNAPKKNLEEQLEKQPTRLMTAGREPRGFDLDSFPTARPGKERRFTGTSAMLQTGNFQEILNERDQKLRAATVADINAAKARRKGRPKKRAKK